MHNRLSQAELEQVITEVERLSQRRDDELNREQVEQILQELNLSPDFLDDALMQVRRRQALEARRRRQRWVAIAIGVGLTGAIATTTLYLQHRQQVYSRISTYQSRITLSQDTGENLTTIDAQTNPQVFYRVTLNNAPIGGKVSLRCDWIDSNGQVAHQNRYSTRNIDQSVWTTYCYHQFNQSSVTGNWKVQMSLGNRVLSSTSFRVK